MFEYRKPKFLFRPRQLWRRLQGVRPADSHEKTIMLRWGLSLRVRASEAKGHLGLTHGLFDLTVCEVLWRLAEPGEWARAAGQVSGKCQFTLAK